MAKIQQIRYNEETDRIEANGRGIHCGDCLEVLLIDQNGSPLWKAVSFEYNDKWYIPGQPGISPIGLFARDIH